MNYTWTKCEPSPIKIQRQWETRKWVWSQRVSLKIKPIWANRIYLNHCWHKPCATHKHCQLFQPHLMQSPKKLFNHLLQQSQNYIIPVQPGSKHGVAPAYQISWLPFTTRWQNKEITQETRSFGCLTYGWGRLLITLSLKNLLAKIRSHCFNIVASLSKGPWDNLIISQGILETFGFIYDLFTPHIPVLIIFNTINCALCPFINTP
jgi:hypothetical protein